VLKLPSASSKPAATIRVRNMATRSFRRGR
jgi:hypothetical protein